MKKVILLLSAFLLIVGMAGAVEKMLIDFSTIVDDYQGQHQETFIDYGKYAGTRYTEEEKQQLNTSLLIPNWDVRLVESSKTVINEQLSYVKPVTVNDTAARFAGQQVLGVRVHFPTFPFNSYAWVEPPFAIPAYATSPVMDNPPVGEQFSGWGALKNVGMIKRIEVNAYGMNHPIGIAVLLSDAERTKSHEIPLGDLNYEGWRTLSWNNPNYISDVRNRVLEKTPLYPHQPPSLVLLGLQFYKGAEQKGGDFICYVKDINVVYDKALLDDIDTDLNHEEVWGILDERETKRALIEAGRVSDKQILRYIEEKKQHVEGEVEEEDATQQ